MTAAMLLLLLIPGETRLDTVVVCPPEFRAALRPWIQFRQAQGHGVALLAGHTSAADIRRDIRRLAAAQSLRYVLLVGDAEPAMLRDPQVRARSVPTHHVAARINVRWGSEPEIASDNWFADLDDDRVPDLAIGRLSVDTPEELTLVVAKILAYERSRDFGLWRRHVQFVAGLGGFGTLADAAVELAAKNVITAGVPAVYSTAMTHANWRSPYCPDPLRFQESALAGLTDGCWFWVYLGHGQRRGLDRMQLPSGQSTSILEAADMAWLRSERGPAIACFLACYTGAFDGQEDCLAEELLRASGGPVAIVCGSRVTMPYAMSVLGTELLDQCFVARQPTLGTALLEAKRATVSRGKISERRVSLDAAASLLSPAPVDLAGEREEHVEMFNLLGDPLLGLKHPKTVKLNVASVAKAGEVLEVSGVAPTTGSAIVELVVRRDRLRFQPPPRADNPTGTLAAAEYADTYRQANDPRWTSVSVPVTAGRAFHATLSIPAEAHGACHVRVFVSGETDFACGAAEVEVSER